MSWKRTARQKVADVLARGDWLTAQQLAQRIGHSTASVSQVLSRMITKNLIARRRRPALHRESSVGLWEYGQTGGQADG